MICYVVKWVQLRISRKRISHNNAKEVFNVLVYEYGRTKQEALSNLCRKMIREYPDEIFTTDFAKVSDYGNEGSDKRYVAEFRV